MKINKILITTIVTSATVCAQVQQHRLLRGGHIRRLQQHNNPYSHTLVEANLAQNTPSCNKDIKICLIGSGYDCAHFGGGGSNTACHEDLPKAGVSGDSFDTDPDHSSPWWQDEIGSGTHNAGILAAVNNDKGVIGLVEGVSLHIARVLGPVGDKITAEEFRAAVRGCINVGANIINFAPVNDMVGGGTEHSQVLEDALEEAFQAGLLVVAGAGDNNRGGDYYYPASYDTVIGVTSIGDQMNQDFNANVNDRIELSAPGIDIDSTWPGSSYQLRSGTGVAATHVSGVAALVWSHYPGCTHTEIRQALQESAQDLGIQGRDDIYGYGLVKAQGALDYLAANPCNDDTMCPEPGPEPPLDSDNDGLTDAEEVTHGTNPNDPDSDNDGLDDGEEVHKYQTDPNNLDSDNDGLNDGQEIIAGTDPNDSDSDNDGIDDGDELDIGTDPLKEDTDGDSTIDGEDDCPLDPNKTKPGVCGCGVSDVDTDGDGTPDCEDDCPRDPNKTEPGVCGCGVSDVDTDGDGFPDCIDQCPTDPSKHETGVCGCGEPDTDVDGDGVLDCNDRCPTDPSKSEPGVCGCGVPDIDTDGDGTLDCNDDCPRDPNKVEPGVCGCGNAEVTPCQPPNADECPTDPNKTKPGICGCNVPDTDSDNDGTPDCVDACPNDKLKTAPGECGCGNAETKLCHGHGDGGHGGGHGGSGHSSPDEPDVDYSELISDLEAQVDNTANSLNDIHITMPAPTQNSDPSIINNEVNSNILMPQAAAPRPPKPEKVKVTNKKVPRKRIKPQKVRRPPNKLKKMPKPPKPVRTKRLPKPPKPPRVRRPPKTRVFRPPPQKAPSCSSYEKQIEQLQIQKMNLQQKNKDLKDENIQLRRMNRINANRASERRKSNIFKKV